MEQTIGNLKPYDMGSARFFKSIREQYKSDNSNGGGERNSGKSPVINAFKSESEGEEQRASVEEWL